MAEVTLYTLPTCSRCKVLKDKMIEKGIEFKEVSTEAELIANDIDMVPILQIGEDRLSFVIANKWINQQ